MRCRVRQGGNCVSKPRDVHLSLVAFSSVVTDAGNVYPGATYLGQPAQSTRNPTHLIVIVGGVTAVYGEPCITFAVSNEYLLCQMNSVLKKQ